VDVFYTSKEWIEYDDYCHELIEAGKMKGGDGHGF
jgi:hypothetical protein